MIGMSVKTGRTLRDRQHLAQSIADIVTTPLGSRVMRREYGSPMADLMDWPLNSATRLQAYAEARLALEEPLILAGDYNVIPEPHDCWDVKVWENDALFLPQTRNAFRRLENLGFTDAVRAYVQVFDLAGYDAFLKTMDRSEDAARD